MKKIYIILLFVLMISGWICIKVIYENITKQDIITTESEKQLIINNIRDSVFKNRVYNFNNKTIQQSQLEYDDEAYVKKKCEQNVMTLGYPKANDNERILNIEHKGIEVRTGNSEWGAEPNKLYFVIMHGAILA